jgi:EAL domain-containing protein (putative c-di-GMP-specific phosphodiesterase class I)
MSVNISASQLRQADLVDDVRIALEKSGLAPSSLILEMTESVLMEHTEENLKALQHLKETGVQLAIDDFGTGYSSLSYLHRFPVDVLKIDRSFVERLVARSREAELIQTIVRLGQGLRLATVAEGIEDHRQFLALKRLGCEMGQGFYFARPMPALEVEKLLGEDKPGPAWRAGQAA